MRNRFYTVKSKCFDNTIITVSIWSSCENDAVFKFNTQYAGDVFSCELNTQMNEDIDIFLNSI